MDERRTCPLEIEAEWRAILGAGDWTSLDALFAITNDAALAKPGLPSWRERMRCSLRDAAGGETTVYLKRFSRPPFAEQVRRWFTGDPNHGTAWTEWTWLGRLKAAGIAAPMPIAYGEQMLGLWERRSALVMSAAPGASLERWCRERPGRFSSALRAALADIVSGFHALGVAHRDLYLAHLFCDDPDSSAPRISIIDLQRVRRLGLRKRRWIVKDLAALNYSTPDCAATPRDRLRWFKAYLRQPRLTRTERIMARWIVAKTERIRQRDRRQDTSR